jgi:hypothetical protein
MLFEGKFDETILAEVRVISGSFGDLIGHQVWITG